MPKIISGGGRPPISKTFLGGATVSVAAKSLYTFTGFNFDVADQSRIIVISVIAGRPAGSSISSVTIGGVAATIVQQYYHALGTMHGICYAAVPAGTSGTVAVQLSGNTADSGCRILGMAIYNARNVAPVGSWQDITSPYNSSGITTAAGGTVIVSSQATFINGGTTTSWTNLTLDQNINGGTTLGASMASLLTTTALSGYVTTATPGSTNASTNMGLVFT